MQVRKKSEDLKITFLLLYRPYFFTWQEWSEGSQRKPAEAGGWDKYLSWGKDVWRPRSVWSTVDGCGEGGQARQVVCCRAGMILGGWVSKTEGRGEGLQLVCLLPWLVAWCEAFQGTSAGVGSWSKVNKWKAMILLLVSWIKFVLFLYFYKYLSRH